MFLFTLILNTSKESGISSAEKELKLLNKNLEALENGINGSNSKEICLKLKESIQIITNKNSDLKSLEPYYHWHDINEVLVKLLKNYCP